jgi:sulfoxide reductase heme-binding subunit YedZ
MIALNAAGSRDLWYIMRGTGLVSLVLLTLTLVAGIANVRRYSSRRLPRAVSALLHRNMALIAVAFLAVHILTAELDSYVKIGWPAVLLPFASRWSPFWISAGTVAIDLAAAVLVTSLLRWRLPHTVWRAVHWAAYACWPLAVAHGIGAGTDSGTPWAQAVYGAACGTVLVAVIWRWRGKRTLPATARIRRLGPAGMAPARAGGADALAPAARGWAGAAPLYRSAAGGSS